MILVILKLFIFFGILFFFGYQLLKWLCRGGIKENLLALSGLIGISFYIFLINAIGHFISIQITFYLVLLIFLCIGLIIFFINKSASPTWSINRNWRRILLFITLILIVVTFIINNRYPLGAEYALLPGMPSAATMVEGNFPPKAIWTPPYPLRYHYGPHLFVGAIYKITGLPLYVAYDIQEAILAGILFLLGFILIKRFDKNNKKALLGVILMLYAGGLVFLKGIRGIPILYNKYINHQDIFAPFKFVFETFEAYFSAPAIERIAHFPTNALGFVLLMGIIYLYLHSRDNKNFILLNIALLATLALVSEAFFAVLCFLLIVYPLIVGITKKNWLKAKVFLFDSLLILIFAVPIVFIQGGVFTHYLGLDGHNLDIARLWGFTHPEFLEKGFEFNINPWFLMTHIGKDNKLPIYSLEFLLQWGLLLFLFLMSIIYFWRRCSEEFIFLVITPLIFFLIPLFIAFPLIYSAMERFFYPVNLIGGLVVGLFLADLYFKEKNVKKVWFKRFIVFIIIILMLQGLIFQLLFLTIGYPPGKWNDADRLFVKKNSFEGKIYQWVKKNTIINDYFLILEPIDESDWTGGKLPNARFILNTGRIAPNYTYHISQGPILVPEPFAFRQIEKTCDPELIKYFNYKYLYATENYPFGLEEKCLTNNNLELKFETKEGNKFVRIYKIIY